MSSLWYPDNINRRDRAMQLSNDITSIQQGVKESKISLDASDKRMAPYLEKVLTNQNMASFQEFQDMLQQSLPLRQRKLYTDLMTRSQGFSEDADAFFNAISQVLSASGMIGNVIDITTFLQAGHVLLTLRDYAQAFATLVTKGLTAGKAAFTAAGQASELAIDALQDASKIANFADMASRILKVVAEFGIIADAFILGFTIYEDSKQRAALRDAINNLYVSRIVSEFYDRLCQSTQTMNGLLISYLMFTTDGPVIDPIDQSAADRIAARIITYAQNDWADIDAASSLDLLLALDLSRVSWTNEDPSYQDAVDSAEQNIDIKTHNLVAPTALTANKPKAVVQPSDTVSVTSMTQLHETVKEAHTKFRPHPTVHVMQSLVHVEHLDKELLRACIAW